MRASKSDLSHFTALTNHRLCYLDCDAAPNELEELLECKGLLLDAGADPTFQTCPEFPGEDSLLSWTLLYGTEGSQLETQFRMPVTIPKESLNLLFDRSC